MTSAAKGKKFGREVVRAVPDPLDGQILTDTITANGPNQYKNLAIASTPTANSFPIEGVSVKALAANAAAIYIVQAGKSYQNGFPLAASESVDLQVDDLNKVSIFIPATGDGVAYIAIESARD